VCLLAYLYPNKPPYDLSLAVVPAFVNCRCHDPPPCCILRQKSIRFTSFIVRSVVGKDIKKRPEVGRYTLS